MLVTTPSTGSYSRPRRTSPSDAEVRPSQLSSNANQHQQHDQVPDDVDDDVTTTTSGSYVIDMSENGGDWRRQIADIYEGVLV